MKNTYTKFSVVGATALLSVGVLAGCASGPTPTDTSSAGGEAISVALLLPETKTARYETFDRPIFTEKLESLGNYNVIYSNADQDSAAQQEQAESALTQGASVIVLDPVDADAAASIVASAEAEGVPVVSYDRLINSGDIDYYVSFDNEAVGVLQGEALVGALDEQGASGGILMINGSPTDPNAAGFKSGAHSVIDDSGYEVLAEFDTPDWSPDEAQNWMSQQITQFDGEFVGVYAANDGTAGGAIAAMKAANVDPFPLVTGQDAELAGIQRIVAGDQFMTVYKSIKQEAELAATVTDQLARGEEPTADSDTDGIPTTLLAPVAVTIDNIMDTVVADDFWTVADICTADFAEACAAAGIE